MDISFSSIGILFAGPAGPPYPWRAGPGSIQSELTPTLRTSQTDTLPVDSSRQTGTYERPTTDNNCGNSQDESVARYAPFVIGTTQYAIRNTDDELRVPPDNIAEIRPPKTLRQNDGTIEATIQFPPAAEISALNLSAPVRAQGSMKAAAAPDAGIATTINNDALHLAMAKNSSGTAQLTSNVEQARAKPILAEVRSGKSTDLKEQQALTRPASRGPGQPMLIPHARSLVNHQATDKTGPKTTAAAANGKRPLMNNFLSLAAGKTLHANQNLAPGPEKSRLAVGKTAEQKSTGSQGTGKSLVGPTIAVQASGKYAAEKSQSNAKKTAADLSGNLGFRISSFEFLPGSSRAAKGAINASPSDVTIGIRQQIAGSIEGFLRQGDRQLTIYLNPPELGRVLVRFQQQQDKITILLEVSKPETRCEIELALPQIMRSLQDSGVQVRHVEVQLSDEAERQADPGRDLSGGQDNGEMAQHRSTQESSQDNGSIHEWLTSTVGGNPSASLGTCFELFGNGSINVLI
jgi:flagellar hook-length control protein FliK